MGVMSPAIAVLAMATTLVIALGWRVRAAPAAGALVGVGILLSGGLITLDDLRTTGPALWRPLLTISSIMVMTTCAHRLGLLDRLAHLIEPRTRGPVRHAFGMVFILSALSAAVLSNDGAILVMTPTVVSLLRQVYPKRHVKFVVPFSFAVFCAAGVAPLITSNPMNLVVADRAGIGFNSYALHMVPVALVGWLTTYVALLRVFRDELRDEDPALGEGPAPATPLQPLAWVVVFALAGVLCAYPVVSYFDQPLWIAAVCGAAVCVAATLGCGVTAREIADGPSWEILPFLIGVLLISVGLERAGLVDALAHIYRETPAPIPVVGTIAAVGSALIDNHPMGLLGWLAISKAGGGSDLVLAALVGGDLGPRLTPIGSLAGLLWLGSLRRQGVGIPVSQFIRVGVLVTLPSLAAALATLWVVTRLL
jgi:arsenical pump membrane protein